jgi:antitoxin ParD1/3/4
MQVYLTPKLEAVVQAELESGRYNTVIDVVSEALRLLEEREQLLEVRRQGLRGEIAEGLDAVRRGERVDGESVFNRIEAELDAHDRPGPG